MIRLNILLDFFKKKKIYLQLIKACPMHVSNARKDWKAKTRANKAPKPTQRC